MEFYLFISFWIIIVFCCIFFNPLIILLNDLIYKFFCKNNLEIKHYKIISNKIKCNHCGDIIESKYIHDYKHCKCGRISIDGGKDYLKRGFKEDGDYEDLSESIEIEE